METGTSPTWKFAKKNRVFDLRFGAWTIGFAQHVLGTSNPDPCWMCSPSGKCILRPRQTIFTNQRRYGQLIPKCVYFGQQERFSKHAILLARQDLFQQQHKIGTLPGLIFKQSYSGRKLAMLRTTIFRPPGYDFGCLECGHHCNSIIVVFRTQNDSSVFGTWTLKFEIWNLKFEIWNLKLQT